MLAVMFKGLETSAPDLCSAFSSYLKVSGYVGSREDANGWREENGKHLEKVAFRSSPVWF